MPEVIQAVAALHSVHKGFFGNWTVANEDEREVAEEAFRLLLSFKIYGAHVSTREK